MENLYQTALDRVSSLLLRELANPTTVKERLSEMSSIFGVVTISIFTEEGYNEITSTVDNQPANVQSFLTNLLTRIAVDLKLHFSADDAGDHYDRLKTAFIGAVEGLGRFDILGNEIMDRIDIEHINDSVMVLFLCHMAFQEIVIDLMRSASYSRDGATGSGT